MCIIIKKRLPAASTDKSRIKTRPKKSSIARASPNVKNKKARNADEPKKFMMNTLHSFMRFFTQELQS
jgi:hypothetical protein